MSEIVDIVNEKDEVIGKVTKEDAHKRALWHRITATLILDENGRILLQKRALNYVGGGQLDHSASGHVLSGEDYDTAARRELKEELGIDVPIKKIVYPIIENIDDIDGRKVRHIFPLYVGKSEGPFQLQESEVESVKFYDINLIEYMIEENPENFPEGFKLSFEAYKNWRSQ